MDAPRVVIAGCGFLGEAAAFLFLDAGWKVLGLCASQEAAQRLSKNKFSVQAVDITKKLTIPEGWRNPELLIHCASSRGGGSEAYRSIYRDGLENALEAFNPQRVIFTGSTSVYSQTDGEWVTETSEACPLRETGLILLEAETLALQAGGVVARLAGIYGPGRSVLLKKFLDNTAVLEDGGKRWINQIHRDDGARALFHLAQFPSLSGIYNVCDDTPATQLTVYEWLAEFLKRPLPPAGPIDLNRKRGWTSKRISNAKLRATRWSPFYTSFRDALPQLTSTTSFVSR